MSRNDYQARPADEKIVMKRSLVTGELLATRLHSNECDHLTAFSALRAKKAEPESLKSRPAIFAEDNGFRPVLSIKRGYDEVEKTKEGAIRVFLKLMERNRRHRKSMEKSLVCHLANIKSRG